MSVDTTTRSVLSEEDTSCNLEPSEVYKVSSLVTEPR